jgi:DNA-binding NarL/FixJ family response regulator
MMSIAATTPNTLLKIAIAEDNPGLMRDLVRKLQPLKQIEIRAMAMNGQELLAALEQDPYIQLVLMDIRMPELDGIAATQQLRLRYPNVRVLMLTIFDDEQHIFEAIMAGANGYLLKGEGTIALDRAMKEAMEGGAPMTSQIAGKVLSLVRNPLKTSDTTQAPPVELSKREVEVLLELKAGLTYDQIAERLFISTGTVRKHIEHIYRKLEVHNKVEAIQKGLAQRLL